jgi:hypothetical protein
MVIVQTKEIKVNITNCFIINLLENESLPQNKNLLENCSKIIPAMLGGFMGLTMKERRPIYREFAEKYRKARNKKSKTEILKNFVETTGRNRNYAATLLRNHGKKVKVGGKYLLKADISKKMPGQGRKKKYDEAVLSPLKRIWKIMDFICGKRLVAILAAVIENLQTYGRLRVSQEVKNKLLEISASSIDRLLKPERKRLEIKGRSGTKPGTLLKNQIAIRTWADWDENRPGYFEMDLVGHDGGNNRGDFAQTLDMVDVYSGWTETGAVKNKAAKWVNEAVDNIKERLPFPLLGLDSDTGGEFINHIMKRYCEKNKIKFTRGRSTRSNDNCYVEQKNYSVVRKTVGYNRYDTDEEVVVLNELYSYLRLYTNHFQPVMKLKEKERIGSKVKKRYYKPVLPYDKIMESDTVDQVYKDRLKTIHENLDLYDLKQNITNCQRKLARLQKKKMRLF